MDGFFFRKYSFSNTNRVSKSLNQDRARRFDGPNLDPNCLQQLLADDTSKQGVKPHSMLGNVHCSCTHHRRTVCQNQIYFFRKSYHFFDFQTIEITLSIMYFV